MDPTDIYGKMDFGTRDRYRHVVERLSRASLHSEPEVASAAIQLAKTKAELLSAQKIANPDIVRYCHVGFYLIDAGLPQLERCLACVVLSGKNYADFCSQWALLLIWDLSFLITGGLVYALLFKASQSGLSDAWL